MSKKQVYLYSIVIILIMFTWLFSLPNDDDIDFSERVKMSLRESGNQLLLKNQDSTSLILPVIDLGQSSFKLAFENEQSFLPNDLVRAISESFKTSKLPEYYRVSVVQCIDEEIAYSYEMSAEKENTIIPCAGRSLPQQCYTIEVKFTKEKPSALSKNLIWYVTFLGLFIIVLEFFIRKQQTTEKATHQKGTISIGRFQFYPEQNKLIKEAVEINLSKKECEILAILVAHPNQIIKRDEITKKVWEDHGVVVSRSLDTYISKLRKKLQDDSSIKITNVHGVGYKLEI